MKRSDYVKITMLTLFVFVSCISSNTFGNTIDMSTQRLREMYKSKFENTVQNEIALPNYASLKEVYNENNYPHYKGERIELNLDSAVSDVDFAPVDFKNNRAIVWDENIPYIEWEVDVPENGLYNLEIEYHPINEFGAVVDRVLMIDGKIPFNEASDIAFNFLWRDAGEPVVNNIGDDVVPSQQLLDTWVTDRFNEKTGAEPYPFMFYLTKGTHTVRLDYINQPFALSSLALVAPDIVKPYSEILAEYKSNGYKNATTPVEFQAESTIIHKTDSTLRRVANDDPKTIPYEFGHKRLNTVGDNYWRVGQQSITWSFEVKETGLYKLGARVGQWFSVGLPSYRQVAIDGEVPFEELLHYKFLYEKDWRAEFFSDENGEPFLFYLTEGTHTLTMTAKLGEFAEIANFLLNTTIDISDISLDVTMLIGPAPDPNYEYELEKNIPDLVENLKRVTDNLDAQILYLKEISGKQSSAASSLAQSNSKLKILYQDPEGIPKRVKDFTDVRTNLTSWYMAFKDEPLIIDYFMVYPPDKKADNLKSGFLDKAKVSINNFFLSFRKDYDAIGGIGDESETADKPPVVLKVWTTRGSERAEIIKHMADEGFSKNTNIYVDMNVVPPGQLGAGSANALMLSLISDSAPDVAMGLDVMSPSEFSYRDAATPLNQFSDYEEVVSKFLDSSLVPLTFQGKTYGLPDTVDFKALFYRSDILNEIGATVPETWEDFINNTLPLLYQNKMTFFLPNDYSMFLFQYGGQYYNEDGSKSALDSPEAYSAFKALVEMYTSYGLNYNAQFFSRFRTGDIPMGIGGFADYMSFSFAAPELVGKWKMAPIPGRFNPDGTINRSFATGVNATNMIMNPTDYPEESWEFLKWWADTETQINFSKQVESLLGPSARWNTANIDAYDSLPWNVDDLKIIKDAFGHIQETPPVLGGYFSTRHFNNAWNRIVVDNNVNWTLRDSLDKAVEDINKELTKKRTEYKHLFDE